MTISLILTIPHCEGTNDNFHIVDEYAKKAINIFKENINSYIDLYIFRGNIERYIIDLNEFNSRDTNFRKELNKEMKNLIKDNKKIFLLDLHSYDFNQNIGKNLEIYFLHNIFNVNITHKLSRYLLNNNISSGVFEGKKNDITFQASNLNIPNILVEFNENLSLINLENVIIHIIQWILFYMK